MRCARHPDVETQLRCGKCDTPICPECTVFGPAGARCKDCAALYSSPLYHVSASSLTKAFAGGMVIAILGGYLLALVQGFGFFLLFGGLIYGQAVASVIQRIAGRKIGLAMELAAGTCTLLGAIIGYLLWYSTQGFPPNFLSPLLLMARNPFYLLAIAAGVFGAISRIRFL